MSPRRLARRPTPILVALPLLALVLDSACFDPPDVGISLNVPSPIASAVAWIEIGAFQKACPKDSELEGGVAMAGPVARVVFPAKGGPKPAFGDLPKATYGFAAVARAADCSVIGVGCSVVNLASASDISIQMLSVPSPRGACEAGSSCVSAVCLAGGDAGGAGASGCSLEFVGAGPLADPLGIDTTLLSAPAIVATGTGFLIAYREFDPDSGSARLTLIPVDDAGGAGTPQRIPLPDRCSESPESDGTGLAWNGSSGAVAVSKHACPSSPPGVDIFAVDGFGATSGGGFSPTGTSGLTLSQAHALSYAPQGLLLTHIDALTRVASVTALDGTAFGASNVPFGDVMSAIGAYVTATGSGAGLLSLGTQADGGVDGSADPLGEGGAALYGSSFTSIGSGGSLSSLPAPNDFSASWASLSGVDSRILVATNGTATSNPILWYAFDVGVVAPVYVDGFTPQATGAVAFADVALHGDNAFFAAQVGDSVALFAFRKASTYPELLVEKDFADDLRIPIGNLRDGLVAVAADATRAAVVWGTGRRVSSLEDLGGYAVFSCVP